MSGSTAVLALAGGVNAPLYTVLLVAHVLLAIVGFGGVMLNGVYAAKAKESPGPEGRAISQANYDVAALAEYAILAVPVTGILLVWVSGGAWSFTDLWVWLSLTLSVVALVVARAVTAPGHRKINALLAAGDAALAQPQQEELERLERIQGIGGGVLGLATVAVVVLMVWKPA